MRGGRRPPDVIDSVHAVIMLNGEEKFPGGGMLASTAGKHAFVIGPCTGSALMG